jgi:copper transport protein
VLGWRIVGGWDALTGTTYGVLLLVKVGSFAVLAAVGGYNRFRLVGRVAAEEPAAAVALLRRTLGVEALLVVAIIAVTGSFTSISPESTPTGPDTTPLTCAEVQVMEGMPGMEQMDHSTCTGTTTTGVPFDPTVGAGTGGAVTARDAFGDGLAVVTVSPATTGRNTVSVTLTDANGNAVDPEEPPTVQFRLRAKDVGPIAAEAERTGPGTYRLVVDFVLPGTWEVNVSAVLSDFEQPQAVVEIRVGS